MDASVGSELPIDALRRVFIDLDWHSIRLCAAVCRYWHDVAREDALWHKHLSFEYYRPNAVAYSAACLPAGWKCSADAAVIAAASDAARATLGMARQQQREMSTLSQQHQHQQQQPPLSVPTEQLQQVVGNARQQEQHTGQPQVAPAGDTPAAGAAAQSHPLQATIGAAGGASCTAGGAESPIEKQPPARLKALFAVGQLHAAGPHQLLLKRFHDALSHIKGWRVVFTLEPQTTTTTTSTTSTSSSSDAACQQPVVGHPAPLTAQGLSAGGWAVGCVCAQQQEQSCWVRFNLPQELITSTTVQRLVAEKCLVATLQALGPSAWFNVATSTPFELLEDEMGILLQSHTSGFYAWDQAGEGGVDRYGQLEPQPWDLLPPAHQQQQQQAVGTDMAVDEAQEAAPGGALQDVQQLLQHQQEQLQEPGGDGDSDSDMEEVDHMPELRMLVYVHYEQLLQVLPWPVPQTMPLPAAPVLRTAADLSHHLAAGPCALWLQLDVCQLHGGVKLGSATVPLAVSTWGAGHVRFQCVEPQVLVTLYDPSSSINSTQGVGGLSIDTAAVLTVDGEAAAGAATEAETVVAAAAFGAAAGAASGSRLGADAADKGAAAGAGRGLLCGESCRQVLLGESCLYGKGSCGSDGLIISTAADALHDLMSMDEVMVDFALFDAAGRLLMGRAGVEVWSKEYVGHTYPADAEIWPEAPGRTPAPSQTQERQQQRWGPGACPADAFRLAALAAAIGPLFPEAKLGHEEQERALAAANSREQALERELLALDSNEHNADAEVVQTLFGQVESVGRSVQTLHFLVDGVPQRFWQTRIAFDTQRAPASQRFWRRATVSLQLTWSSLRSLFSLPPFAL